MATMAENLGPRNNVVETRYFRSVSLETNSDDTTCGPTEKGLEHIILSLLGQLNPAVTGERISPSQE